MKKRILSCVLSAALLLGLTPWSALATDDPLDDQTSQAELQTNFQSPPQDPDIYADPQPSIQAPEPPQEPETPEVVPEVQTTAVAVQDGETHSHSDNLTFAHKLTSIDDKLYIDGEPQTAAKFGYELSISGGCYYLDSNLTLDKPLVISTTAKGGVVNLCLNAHIR